MAPVNDKRVSHRDKSLDYLDSSRQLVDLIASLHEQRRNLGITDVEAHRARELGHMIGEANGQLGFALKAADVHATLALADAVADLEASPDLPGRVAGFVTTGAQA